MYEPTNNSQDCDCEGCVDNSLVVFMVLFVLAITGALGYAVDNLHPVKKDPAYILSEATTKAQSELAKTEFEARAAYQKRLQNTQEKVITTCVDKGGVPIILNGNIDCKR